MRVRRQTRGSGRGQAMIETAVVVLLIILVLVGVFAVATLANDQNTATTAVRAGGRFAAELGNGTSLNVTTTDPLPVDREIATEVCKVASTMPDLNGIDKIIIYRPATNPDGSFSASDLSDTYQVTGSNCQLIPGTRTYTLDKRNTIHPTESQVGIYIQYHYISPTPFFHLDLRATTYTVVTLAPSFG